MTDKQSLRKEIETYRKQLSDETVSGLSQKICDRLIATDLFVSACCIAFYYALPKEVQTARLIEEWRQCKKIVLPAVVGDTDMKFYAYEGAERMTTGKFGISEPLNNTPVAVEDIDLFVVPGVAFDRSGNRLGRGKGFYDRILAGTDKPVTGLCFDFQLIDAVPVNEYDKKMSMVITENTVIAVDSTYTRRR